MLPENLAVAGGYAEQIAVGAKGIKQIAINGWGGSWSRVVRPLVFADLADPDGPQPLAIVDIDSVEKFFVSLAAQQKHAPAGNGRRRITAAQSGSLPYQFRPALRPFLEKPCLGGNSGAVATAPTRPVALWSVRLGEDRRGCLQEDCEERQSQRAVPGHSFSPGH